MSVPLPDSPAAVIADLDGTLADTAPGIHRAGSLMLRELGLPEVPPEDSPGYIGDGLNRYVKRLLLRKMWGEPDPDLLGRALSLMRRLYEENLSWQCELFPGVAETLESLSGGGVRLGCVTNKPERLADRVLSALGIRGVFSSLVGGDTLPQKKPDPEPIYRCMGELGAGRASTLFVGDGSADSKACARAGVFFVAVSYGYNRYPIGTEHFNPDMVIDSFPQVADVVALAGRGAQARHG